MALSEKEEWRGRKTPRWLEGTPPTKYPPLEGHQRFDAAVIGAGITGMTAALLLAREGLSVCVVDQGSVGAGTTGYTTAKVTSQHHLTYARIRVTHGKAGAATYGAAMEAAKERVAALVGERIECDFRRRPAYVYASRPGERMLIERETSAAQEAGLPATFDEDVPLPFETKGGMRFDDQAELHARKYLLGLAERLERAGGRVFERTRAVHVEDGSPCIVETERGRVDAEHVVVATLMPFLDRGGFFARAFPSRSYVVTARIDGALPDAMLVNAAPRCARCARFRSATRSC